MTSAQLQKAEKKKKKKAVQIPALLHTTLYTKSGYSRVRPFWLDLWLKVKAAGWNSIFPAMDVNSLGDPCFPHVA